MKELLLRPLRQQPHTQATHINSSSSKGSGAAAAACASLYSSYEASLRGGGAVPAPLALHRTSVSRVSVSPPLLNGAPPVSSWGLSSRLLRGLCAAATLCILHALTLQHASSSSGIDVQPEVQPLIQLLPASGPCSSSSKGVLLFGSEMGAGAAPRRLKAAEVKPLKTLKDASYRDAIGMLLVALASIVAVCAGTGAQSVVSFVFVFVYFSWGAVYVPIMTLVMGLSTHEATVASQALMSGGVLAGTLLNISKHHPLSPHRPLIDMNLVLFLGPAQIAGVSFGLVINRCLASWLIMVLLLVVLSFSAIKCVKQYKRIVRERKQEKASAAAAGAAAAAGEGKASEGGGGPPLRLSADERGESKAIEMQPPASAFRSLLQHSTLLLTALAEKQRQQQQQQQGKEEEERQQQQQEGQHQQHQDPDLKEQQQQNTGDAASAQQSQQQQQQQRGAYPTDLSTASGLQTSVIINTFSAVTAREPPAPRWCSFCPLSVPYCGWEFWLLYVSGALLLLVASVYQGCVLLARDRRVTGDDRSLRLKGDLIFTPKVACAFFLQSIGAGIVGGIVGIGGSMIMGPLMLSRGLLPAVVTAVNTTSVLSSSSSAAAKSILSGAVPWDYCVLFFVVCFACALVGKFLVDKIVKKRKADHYLVLFLLAMIFGSMACMFVSGITSIVKNERQSFQGPC
ncbi:hypothetical protein Esti_004386 [Eimeria stiedai]